MPDPLPVNTAGTELRSPWAARLPLECARAAAALRAHPGVTGLVAGGVLWLRGDAATRALDKGLTRLAPAAWYTVDAAGRLIPRGLSLPVGTVPAGTWVPLADLLAPAPPPSLLPAARPARVTLRVVRSADERPATILLVPVPAFAGWAEDAPAARLHRLRFAATATDAIVWGEPLPPLPGPRYHESAGIALPVGFTLAPAVDPPSLRSLLGLADGDLARFASDATYGHVPAAAFVVARRSAVRLTVASATRPGGST